MTQYYYVYLLNNVGGRWFNRRLKIVWRRAKMTDAGPRCCGGTCNRSLVWPYMINVCPYLNNVWRDE